MYLKLIFASESLTGPLVRTGWPSLKLGPGRKVLGEGNSFSLVSSRLVSVVSLPLPRSPTKLHGDFDIIPTCRNTIDVRMKTKQSTPGTEKVNGGVG